MTNTKYRDKIKVLLEVPVGLWAEIKSMATVRGVRSRDLAVEILDWAIRHGYRLLSEREKNVSRAN